MGAPGREGGNKLSGCLLVVVVGVSGVALAATIATKGHPANAPRAIASGIGSAAQPNESSAACTAYSTHRLNTLGKIANAISDRLPASKSETYYEVLSTLQDTSGNNGYTEQGRLLPETEVNIPETQLCKVAGKIMKISIPLPPEPAPTPS